MEDDRPTKGSAMIALLPMNADWCTLKVPHCTLVYAGEIADLEPGAFNAMAKDACSLAMLACPINLRVDRIEVFGEGEEQVDVFTLVPNDEIRSMRNFVEHWNASEYDEYKPHVTIGPPGRFIDEPPRYIAFDRVTCGWGDDYITFRMKNSIN